MQDLWVLFSWWGKPSGGDRRSFRWASVVHLWEKPVRLQCISRTLLCFDRFQARFDKRTGFFLRISQNITLHIAVSTTLISCNRECYINEKPGFMLPSKGWIVVSTSVRAERFKTSELLSRTCFSLAFWHLPVLSLGFSLFHSYLVMPYMFTDLSKVRGPLSEDKVQFLIYQTLCGLRVSPTVKKPMLHNILKFAV